MAMTVDQFMTALSGQESGGSYSAQNKRTGAYGRFQILPSNWPSWAREAGIPGAPQTPENQERVARFKLQQYYNKYGNWGDVASVWYSGSPLSAYTPAQLNRKQGNGDEPSIQEYVNQVMARGIPGPPNTGGGGMSYSWARNETQGYGPTSEPLDKGFNLGIDYGVPEGTPIESNVKGRVSFIGQSGGWGLRVTVTDENGFVHGWGHLSSAEGLRLGQEVNVGDVIARSGNSGTATTGAHVSYDVQDSNGQYIDPRRFVGEGSTGMADPAGSAEYQQALATLKAMQADPRNSPSHEDFAEWQTYIAEQARIVAALEPRASSSSDPLSRDPNDVLNTDFQNKLQELQLSLSFDNTNLAKAVADLDRFLGLKEDSRARTAAIAEGQDLIRRWGTPAGKSSYSLSDLGSGFEAAGAVSGLDPNKPFINYTGTIRIDPEADMRRFDAASGVNGQAPGIPSLITDPSQFPNSPTLDQSTYYGQPAGANPYYDGGDAGVDKTVTSVAPIDIGLDPDLAPAPFMDPNVGANIPQGQAYGGGKVRGGSWEYNPGANIPMPQPNPHYSGRSRGGRF